MNITLYNRVELAADGFNGCCQYANEANGHSKSFILVRVIDGEAQNASKARRRHPPGNSANPYFPSLYWQSVVRIRMKGSVMYWRLANTRTT